MRLGELLLLVVSCFVTSHALRCMLGDRLGEYKIVDSLYQCKFTVTLQNNGTLQLIGYPYQVNERGGCFFHPLGMVTCDCFASYCNYRIDQIVKRIRKFKDREQKKSDRDKMEQIIEKLNHRQGLKANISLIWREHNTTAQRFVKKTDDFTKVARRTIRLAIGVGFFIVFFAAGVGYECYNQRRKNKDE